MTDKQKPASRRSSEERDAALASAASPSLPTDDEQPSPADNVGSIAMEMIKQQAEVNKALMQSNIAMAQQMKAQGETMETIAKTLTERKAPAQVSNWGTESAELAQSERRIETGPNGEIVRVPPELDPQSGDFMDLAETVLFMKETLPVYVHPSSDKSAYNMVEFTTNGEEYVFQRGRAMPVPRYVVEAMARSVSRHVRQEKTLNPDDDNQYMDYFFTSTRFNFNVQNDSERGRRWLEWVIRQETVVQ